MPHTYQMCHVTNNFNIIRVVVVATCRVQIYRFFDTPGLTPCTSLTPGDHPDGNGSGEEGVPELILMWAGE